MAERIPPTFDVHAGLQLLREHWIAVTSRLVRTFPEYESVFVFVNDSVTARHERRAPVTKAVAADVTAGAVAAVAAVAAAAATVSDQTAMGSSACRVAVSAPCEFFSMRHNSARRHERINDTLIGFE